MVRPIMRGAATNTNLLILAELVARNVGSGVVLFSC